MHVGLPEMSCTTAEYSLGTVLCVTPPGHPQLPCHWLAPDAAAALSGLMAPADAGLFIIPLAPVAALPASVLLSARLHPGVPIASSATDAAIAMCFLVSFIAHSSWDWLEPGPGRRISSTMDFSRSSGKQQIACLTFNGTHRSWIVRNEFGASRIPAMRAEPIRRYIAAAFLPPESALANKDRPILPDGPER